MLFEKTLEEIKALVDGGLTGFFQRKKQEEVKLDINSITIADQIADLTLRGGKRTRAFLVWLGYSSVIPAQAGIHLYKKWIPDQVGDDRLVSAMLAVELFQSFALIHDDIIDEDTERRGGPTVNEYFKLTTYNSQLTTNAARHFGVSMAVLAGDLALSWAMELVGKTKNERVYELFLTMSEETILGQTLDVLKEQAGKKIEKKKIDELKTGFYTVVRPLQLGALLGGGNDQLLDQLKSYGLAVGRAFQLTDDFLDGDIEAAQFQTEKQTYLQKVKSLTPRFGSNPEVRNLFSDFAGFVVTRSK